MQCYGEYDGVAVQLLPTDRCSLDMNRTFHLKTALIAMLSLAILAPASGQTTYGLQQNVIPWQQGLYLGGYDVLSNTWVYGDTLPYAEGFALGSSTYDQWEDGYVFIGVPSGGGSVQWMSQPVDGSDATLTPMTGNVHSVHHDMQNGNFYALEGYPTDSIYVDLGGDFGYWDYLEWGTRLVKINAFGDAVTTLPLFEMPWLNGVVAGASCYDSDTHRFFVWGITSAGTAALTTLDASTGEIVWNVPIVTPGNLSEFEYNIEDGQLIGLRSIVDAAGNADMSLITVDPETGSVTDQLDLPQVGSYTPDGTVFDQLNGLYIMHYYQGIGLNSHVLAVDVATWEVVADHALEANFLELEMSNADFADLRYGVASVKEPAALEVRLEAGHWVNAGREVLWVTRFDATGRCVQSAERLGQGEALEVPGGWWIWSFEGPNHRASRTTFRP